ncbi:hypothetical protein GCM10009780_14580 [Actinomadura alba]
MYSPSTDRRCRVVRRQILRERDIPGDANIDLLDTIVRWSLNRGDHVLLEGILASSRYGHMLEALIGAGDGLQTAYSSVPGPCPWSARGHGEPRAAVTPYECGRCGVGRNQR